MPTGTLLVVGEILEAHADTDLVQENGRDVDMARLDPLVYITGNREYFRLGERVADAYSIGRGLYEAPDDRREDG
jgi:flavin reductase (DIM6/NTAB) family NADH-FMN oxidoreductase RutF